MIFVCSMGDLFHEDVTWEQIIQIFDAMNNNCQHRYLLLTKRPEAMNDFFSSLEDWQASEFPHIWLGVSVENDKHLDRIETLLQIPAAKRFVSIEPMLGPVDLKNAFAANRYAWDEEQESEMLDWVICGGESGPGARPMHPDWVRSVRDQCQAAGVPFFFKQWGAWTPLHELRCNEPGIKGKMWHNFDPDNSVCKVGKKKAGRLLDGREWNERPEYD